MDGWASSSSLSDADELDEPLPSGSIHISLSDNLMNTATRDPSIQSRQLSSEHSPGASFGNVVWEAGGNTEDATGHESDKCQSTNMTFDDEGPPVHTVDNGAPPPMVNRAGASLSSLSTISDLSDASFLQLSSSSKATTPAEADTSRTQRSEERSEEQSEQLCRLPAYPRSNERLNITTRPKSSIPINIPLSQYAIECIEAAESSRLNPYALHPEEYLLLQHHLSHAQVTTYLNIRNGILRIWIRHPWAGVTRQEAIGLASSRWFDAASVCYDWLLRRGYINFGCLQVPDVKLDESSLPRVKRRRTVVVVGAGISGLACARQLEGLFRQYADRFDETGEQVPRVVVVEGRGRLGGRVYSRELKTKPSGDQPAFPAKRHTAELGGMIITGFDRGNPLNILVRGQLALPYHALTADTTIYDSNGKPVDPIRDQLVEKLYNDCLDRASEFKFKPQPSKLIEGSRDLLLEGRDSSVDGGKSIMQAEEALAALLHAPSVWQQNVPEKVNMVPISAHKLTGRVYNEPGVPATLKAADKVKTMGWSLRSGTAHDHNINLNEAAALDNATLGSVLDNSISQYKHMVELSAQDHRLINWHVANLEYSNAVNLHNLSLELWDIDAGNEWEGQHSMIVGGFQDVARGLLQCPTNLNLKTKFPVKTIRYHADGFIGPAVIESEDGTSITADCVVCTVPLGVLKQGSLNFDPPLPAWKTGVIERLGFGVLNKVVLVYEEVFWDPGRHIFGVLRNPLNRHSTTQNDYAASRGRFFQWFNVSNTAGLPCLIALMAGDAGFETEHSSNDQLVAEATEILRRVFGHGVPYPVEAIVTRWGSDRFSRGSYSSAAPGMLPDDYNTMARPLGNLFFAGEHTIGTHPATVHGAYLSGLRAASEMLDALIGPIEIPTPLILPKDSLLLYKRKQAAEDPRQARLEAYEIEVSDYVRSQIGERPTRPTMTPGNAFLVYSKAHLEEARMRCEKSRRFGRMRSIPNEIRAMTSRMWKNATAEQRKPFEDQAAAQKSAYADAMHIFNEQAQRWDHKANILRAAYEKDHPSVPGPDEVAHDTKSVHKHSRAKYVP